MNFEDAILLAKSRSDCHPDNIDSLVQIVNELAEVPGDIAECGSWKCGATIAIARTAQRYYPVKAVFAFDLFGGLPYGTEKGFANFGDADFKEIVEAVREFPIYLIRGSHEETIPRFTLGNIKKLSLIFMDSDFYESHKVCLSHFWPLLSSGGKIVFHDWSFPGVQKAIRETIPMEAVLDIGRVPAPSDNMGYITKR